VVVRQATHFTNELDECPRPEQLHLAISAEVVGVNQEPLGCVFGNVLVDACRESILVDGAASGRVAVCAASDPEAKKILVGGLLGLGGVRPHRSEGQIVDAAQLSSKCPRLVSRRGQAAKEGRQMLEQQQLHDASATNDLAHKGVVKPSRT
jgi:hypothetical protein